MGLALTEETCARILNFGVMLSCFARAAAYSGVLGEASNSPGPQILSDDGQLLWFYGGLWAACGFMGLVDFIRGRVGFGIMSTVPLMAWWAWSYLVAWVVARFHSWDWVSFTVYIGSCFIISGLVLMVISLRMKNRGILNATGVIEVLRNDEMKDGDKRG